MKKKYLLIIMSLVIAGCASKKPDYPSNTKGAIPKKEAPSKYGNPKSYNVFGTTYHVKKTSKNHSETGIASWYGKDFHGKRTSSGTSYNMYNYSAAHRTLPIPTYVLVTNLENNRQVIVRVDDRGPFAKNRIIDLSYQAALSLDMIKNGTAKVKVEALAPHQSLEKEAIPYNDQTHKITPTEAFIKTEASLESNNRPDNSSYALQLNAFGVQENAIRFSDSIRMMHNLDSTVYQDGSLFRVIVPNFDSRETALNASQDLAKIGIPNTIFQPKNN